MTRTDTTATIPATALTLTPALACVLRQAPLVTAAQPWEPTTLHASVVRRPGLAGTVPLPGQRLFGAREAAGAGRAPKHLRSVRPWAVAVALAAFVTVFTGSLAGLLADRTPAAPAPGGSGGSGGSSVSAPAHVTPASSVTPLGR